VCWHPAHWVRDELGLPDEVQETVNAEEGSRKSAATARRIHWLTDGVALQYNSNSADIVVLIQFKIIRKLTRIPLYNIT
jgi:hypothetical protein